MKIVYRGGYNKLDEESVKKSVIYDYEKLVKKAVGRGEKVAFVTLAKPDGYYHGAHLRQKGKNHQLEKPSGNKVVGIRRNPFIRWRS